MSHHHKNQGHKQQATPSREAREVQTAKQREAARRRAEARAAAIAAEKAARKARQLKYGIIAGVALLALLGALLWNAFRDHGEVTTPEAPVATPTAPTTPEQQNDPAVPDPAIAEGRTWTATIDTTVGPIVVELDGAAAPQAVANFIYLARDGFFNDTFCHRLTTAGIFVLQCGDPTGTGMGGPGWNFGPIENAPANDMYPAGTLAMARVGGNAFSMGSQFFLVYEDSLIPSDMAGGYTVFGRITSGLEHIQAVADAGVVGGAGDGQPATNVTIEGVSVQ